MEGFLPSPLCLSASPSVGSLKSVRRWQFRRKQNEWRWGSKPLVCPKNKISKDNHKTWSNQSLFSPPSSPPCPFVPYSLDSSSSFPLFHLAFCLHRSTSIGRMPKRVLRSLVSLQVLTHARLQNGHMRGEISCLHLSFKCFSPRMLAAKWKILFPTSYPSFSIPDHQECLCAPSYIFLHFFPPPSHCMNLVLFFCRPSSPYLPWCFVSLERMISRNNVPKRVSSGRRDVFQGHWEAR